jgi:hypothetical protein
MNSPRPIQLTLALIFASIETLTAAVVTIFFAYGLVFILLTIVGLMLATTAFLTSATFALSKFKRWGRSALIFWQFLQISLGWGSIDGKNGILWLGIAIFAISGITAILLFSKAVSKAIPN